ncbi:AraC family transcriptional regulator [Alteromonas sp. a30]|uniref:AraC family transcriptional regulator n=1 Tax=Alteromonas sp. a30 TaxID=2730917 RepID=UPI00227D9DA9|nr:AraC family transcriptional regulator [Alteromonas sp. a30]MCY7296634.1 helix-turn-helix domain-containing protein [Alteromonas sp. a30]
MPKIALDTLRSLLNHLALKGIEKEAMLAHLGMTKSSLNVSGELIDIRLYESLYAFAERHLDSKTIGFELGQNIEPDRWGTLGYIAFTSPSIKEALACQRRYQSLVGNMGTPLQEISNNKLILKWLPSYACSHNTVEEIITGWTAMARKLSNKKIKPIGIYFGHECQSDMRVYEDFYDCEVRFSCDYHGIKIYQDTINQPFNRHDPEVHALLCQHADSLLNRLAERRPVESVTKFITNQLPFGVPEIEDAAQNLHVSVRTLQRKLGEYDITFSGLIDSIRKELALSYLRNTNTKIVYITQMLGFSEQSAFQRAFKRWTGKTPRQYRNNE